MTTVRISTNLDPFEKPLKAPYHSMTVTVRRLRTPEWESAREAALAIVRDDAKLLTLMGEYDLLPKGGVKGWKRMRDNDPLAYAHFMVGISMWLTAVECALVGLVEWSGITLEDGKPAPLTREVLQAALLDDNLSDQIMGVLTEAARLLITEGEP